MNGKRVALTLLALLGTCCGCCGLGFFFLRFHAPDRHLVGTPLPSIKAIQLYSLARNTLILWDVFGNLSRIESGKVDWTYKMKGKIADVAIRPNRIAILTQNAKIILLDPASGKAQRTIAMNSGAYKVCLSPDGERLAVVNGVQDLVEWNAEDGRQIATMPLKDSWNGEVVGYAADGKTVLTCGAGIGYAVNPPSDHSLGHSNFVAPLSEGSVLVGKEDSKLVLFDRQFEETWKLDLTDRIWNFTLNESQTKALIAMPGRGPWLGGRTAVVDLKTREVDDLNHPDQPMTCLAWVGDIKLIGGSNGDIFAYDQGPNPLASLKFSDTKIRQILVTESDVYIVDEAGTTHRWSTSELAAL